MPSEWLQGVRALVCDFDGTIADSHYDFPAMRAEAIRLAGKQGIGPEAFEGLFTLEAIERVAGMLGEGGEGYRRAARAVLTRYELAGARAATLLPAAVAGLHRLLAAGYRVAVITGNCRAAVDVVMAGRPPVWQKLLTRDDVALPKPHAEHALAALSALGAGVGEAVLVGDHALDIETGRRAGLRTVGVLTGGGTSESLAAAGADLIVPDLGHLAELLLPPAQGERGAPHPNPLPKGEGGTAAGGRGGNRPNELMDGETNA